MSKPRPALVLFDLGQDIVICRITSVSRTGPLDVQLFDWQHAGLALPSTARIDRLVTAERSLLTRRLGQLSSRDQDAVRQTWNRQMIL